MSDLFVSIAFWVLFPLGGIAVIACLVGTVWKNVQMTTARWHVEDDGAEEGVGYEVYKLYLASERLAKSAYATLGLMAVTGLAGAFGPAWLKLAAIAASVVLALASDAIRTRHAKLETGFERRTGEPLETVYRRMHETASHA